MANMTNTMGRITNQTFHLPRFMQYVRAHLTERKRTYFWHFAVSAMIYFIILLMVLPDDEPRYEIHMQMVFYYAELIITGGVFALRYFSSLARPESALISLMQPVSAFEKWLLAVIVTVVAYPIVFTVIYVVMTYPVIWLSLQAVDPSDMDNQYREYSNFGLFLPLTNFDKAFSDIHAVKQLPVWLSYTSLCGYALTTSVLFKRLPMIKSIALGFGLFLLFLLMTMSVSPDAEVLFHWFDFRSYAFSFVTFLPSLLLWVAMPILMLWASFRAIKERDLV